MYKKSKILVVLPDIPFPPRKNGFSVRYYPLLTELKKYYDVSLAVLLPSEYSEADLKQLWVEGYTVFPISRPVRSATLLERLIVQFHRVLPRGVPYSDYDHSAKHAVEQLAEVLSGHFDAVLWVVISHVLDRALPLLKRHRLILDAVDSPSLYVARSLSGKAFVERLRIAKMLAWEVSMVNAAQKVWYISPVDMQMIKPHSKNNNLEVLSNAALVNDYTAEKVSLRSPSIGFLGNMSYAPNIDAAHYLHELYLRLKEKVPNLSLYVIGRDPDISLLRYRNDPDVHVTGTVDNIWHYINAVDVFVLPMREGSGQQNKLLEIMYAGRPIVASSVANSGIMGVDGASLLIADDLAAMEGRVLGLLSNDARREELGAAGARFVREQYGWDAIAARFLAAIANDAGNP